MNEFSVHPATRLELQEAMALRIRVFVDIQKFPLEEEVDEHDNDALHFVVTQGEKVVGTLRVVQMDGVAKIGRVVISPEHQGHGLGRLLMDRVEAHLATDARFKEYEWCKLGSQYDKRVFYEKCGYEARGDIYDELGCPHIWMYKAIIRK
ncbi:hypothetical protein IWW50_006318 [Coemansia erecta]|nr:hypothetical protein IWW50_006318 [Coemansia erecta]